MILSEILIIVDGEVRDCKTIKKWTKMHRDRKNKVVSNKRWEIKSSTNKLWKISQGEIKIKTQCWMFDQIVFMVIVGKGIIALKGRGAKVLLIWMHQLHSTDTQIKKAILVCMSKTICFSLSNQWFLIIEIKTLNYEITWATTAPKTSGTKSHHMNLFSSIKWSSKFQSMCKAKGSPSKIE